MGDEFRLRLQQLHHDLVQQGQRVEAVVERAFQSVFDSDEARARSVVAADDVIDRVDVEIERAAVKLLGLEEKNPAQLRLVLTIVKVNNELERVADLAVDVVEQLVFTRDLHSRFPASLRVMANSVIGMIRDADRALRGLDIEAARSVLTRDDLVDEFKRSILREVQERLAANEVDVDFATAVWMIAIAAERMADHTTNICEQVIYVETGQIVRHSAEGWSEPMSIE
ncbi:MAG: phosphate signaling complex protein PhoU [Phycisphaerales bacterium]